MPESRLSSRTHEEENASRVGHVPETLVQEESRQKSHTCGVLVPQQRRPPYAAVTVGWNVVLRSEMAKAARGRSD
jgi:hypothetical protein